MTCSICLSKMNMVFHRRVLNKNDIAYFYCQTCGYLQTENPFWLEEAYKQSINVIDTGIMSRNINFSKLTSVIIYFLFNRQGKFVDLAGGYGFMTRLMRDIGFDFYWHDQYTQNLVARGFEYDQKSENEIELLTVFEAFEHFINPIDELNKMLNISNNILFTTELLPNKIPNEWWYYGFEHGQHISFYSLRTLNRIAKKYNLFINSNGINIHLLSKRKISSNIFNTIVRFHRYGLDIFVRKRMLSKTFEDMEQLRSESK